MLIVSKSRRPARSRFHSAFRPKSYWPAGGRLRANPQDEVELVRISLSTPNRDVVTFRARRADRHHIVYRLVHEDVEGRTRHRIRVRPASSARPLAFGEIVALLEDACFAGRCQEGDERFRGVIWGTLQLHLEHGTEHADDYLFMLKVRSTLYPQLERYFDERLHDWCLENCVEEEDCGEVVRLRRGRFARKVAA